MAEEVQNAFMYGIAKVGDGVGWVTENIIKWLSQYGYNITAVQSKILTLLILGVMIYFILGVLHVARKILKWGIIVAIIFLMLSVLLSIFI